MIFNRLARFGLKEIDLHMVTEWADGLSHADICQSSDAAAKDAVLKESKTVDLEALRDALAKRQNRRSFKNEAG